MPAVPQGPAAHFLAGLRPRDEPPELRRLPQSDGQVLGLRPAREDGSERDLLYVPPAAAHRVPQTLAHAAARGENVLQRLPQSPRLGHPAATQSRQRELALLRLP